MNEEDIKKIISRVTAEVVKEVQQAEVSRGISLSDLKVHAKELGGGKLDAAWTISYDTKGSVGDIGREDLSAWKISYDTKGRITDIGDKNK